MVYICKDFQIYSDWSVQKEVKSYIFHLPHQSINQSIHHPTTKQPKQHPTKQPEFLFWWRTKRKSYHPQAKACNKICSLHPSRVCVVRVCACFFLLLFAVGIFFCAHHHKKKNGKWKMRLFGFCVSHYTLSLTHTQRKTHGLCEYFMGKKEFV